MNPSGILLGVFLIVVGVGLHFYYQGRFAGSDEGKQSVEDLVESLPTWFVKLAPAILVVGGIIRVFLATFAQEHAA